jgi:GTP-binding protein HflX
MADFLPTLPKAQRAFLIGVQTPEMPEGEGEELLAELTELVENLGLTIVRTDFVKLRAPPRPSISGRERPRSWRPSRRRTGPR